MDDIPALPTTQPADMRRCREWAARHLARAADLPISFALDGQPVAGLPASWQPTATRRWIDANIVETVYEGADPASGLSLRVEVSEYRDYPAVEWVAWFANRGQADAPLLEDVLALDATFPGRSPALRHCNGDLGRAAGYATEQAPLPPGEALRFAPHRGRPSDGAFPYYRLLFPEGGVSLAIGWPGQWAASFEGRADGARARAGQETLRVRLRPGEQVRTPRITAVFWAGGLDRGVNLWRRWYLAHVLPRPDGQPLGPLLACAASDEGEEFTAATEENQIRFLDRFQERGIRPDIWWLDAGWYPCRDANGERRWGVTGTWETDAERFPRGLGPVSEHAAEHGAKLLLWFEPERVRPGTWLDRERPEWVSRPPGDNNGQLMLSLPACRQWLTDHVCRLIQENGVAVYRQDHNFTPLQHWRRDEAEDRQGLRENLHVQGYLQYYDDLLARNPGLWLDSCASGGRRNDLETLRRSVPLHYTDYGYGDHPIKLAFHHTMYEWIPYFKESTVSWDLEGASRYDHRVDSFSFHCGMAPMLMPSLDIRREDYDFALAARMIALWRRAAPLLLRGDYYPLAVSDRTAATWAAWQFDSPETGEGLIQAIRLPAAPEELTLRPRGLAPEATYAFENAETGERWESPGGALLEQGLNVALPPRSGAIWFYRRIDQATGR